MTDEVSLLRLHLMRCLYLLNFVLIGSGVCAAFLNRQEVWDPMVGVALGFWAALAGLSGLGIRNDYEQIGSRLAKELGHKAVKNRLIVG